MDFHSLRVVYVSLVLESGAGVKEAQSLARHQTPTLTMNVYGRARGERLHEIAERVGEAVQRPQTPTIPQQQVVGIGNPSGTTTYAGAYRGSSPLSGTT